MNASRLRAIPSVEKVLQSLGDAGLPRPLILDQVRRELGALRKQKTIPEFDAVVSTIRARLRNLSAGRIQPVINGTGILIHTNFGRAPLGPAVIEKLKAIGSSYNNLEYDLTGGVRGGRAAYLERALSLLCSSEAATVVNNNAAALVLILRHFCGAPEAPSGRSARKGSRGMRARKSEVIISRGELIQIGGGFRIPDILESSGAKLREVGTTNHTTVGDYARAITRETALILKVHRSNFFMGGFVESPPPQQVAALARRKRIPFVEDLGSGAIVETEASAGVEHEPTPAEVIRRGVDLVCFSGDKLLGGPQAGIIAGKAALVGALKRNPLFRALRCDKLILSALETTADIYLGSGGADLPQSAEKESRASDEAVHATVCIPVLEMLNTPLDALRSRADKIVSALAGLPLSASVGIGQAQIGGGTLPQSVISSVTIDLSHKTLKPQDLATRLRENSVPVIGYIARGKLKFDLRTIFPRQDAQLANAIRAAAAD
ncbi:MAG TPA: L-seryl-tRNA(Sec) selenium transferase [Candidatus Acidoferrales bacterium]